MEVIEPRHEEEERCEEESVQHEPSPAANPGSNISPSQIIDVDVGNVYSEMQCHIEEVMAPMRADIEALKTRLDALMLYFVRGTSAFNHLPPAPANLIIRPDTQQSCPL